jgi:hypothetical protein
MRRRRSALDPSGVDVERPGQHHGDGEAEAQQHDDDLEHRIRQTEPVLDRLDDLQDRERHDAVADQHAEDAAAFQLGDEVLDGQTFPSRAETNTGTKPRSPGCRRAEADPRSLSVRRQTLL